VFGLLEPAVKEVINVVFSQGIDVSWILKMIGLDFIQFEKTLLVPMDNYFLFFVTPIFKLELLDGVFKEILENGYKYMTSNEVLKEVIGASTNITKSKVEEQFSEFILDPSNKSSDPLLTVLNELVQSSQKIEYIS
jgi:hypothetical protein